MSSSARRASRRKNWSPATGGPYHDFYRWGSIVRGAWAKDAWGERLRHVAYAGGWKKFEPLWDLAIRARRVTQMLPVLEGVLSGFGRHAATVQLSKLVGEA